MWIVYGLASAFFAGIMSVLAKIGIKNTDSTLATALRTVVAALFAWLTVFIVGSQTTLGGISAKSLVFLILSGLATGASWLCYFRALQLGDVNKVVPVDKSSTVLTMMLSFIILGEKLTVLKLIAMALIGTGVCLMVERRKNTSAVPQGRQWLGYAVLSAIFAALTAILGKIGIEDVESNLGTAIRTLVVLAMAWLMVFLQGKQRGIRHIDRKSYTFIILSGAATGLSWLCFYRALQDGPASVLVPIDKLSILVTVAFGYFVLHEKLSRRSLAGLLMIVVGTLAAFDFL
mgnify:CR=1 FL=1|jgi:transporter family protein